MTYNLNGNFMGSESIGFGPSAMDNALHTQAKAVIFLVKPHHNQFMDVGLRPYVYHFDEQMVGEATQMMDLAKRGGVGEAQMLEHVMSRTNFNNNLVTTPAAIGQFHASLLSDRWRFMLVLTESARQLAIPQTAFNSSPGNTLRRIYTGYFEDEPLSIQRSFNPHAYMVITHKTVVEMHTSYGALGAERQLLNRSSEEVLNPGLFNSLVSGQVGQAQGTFLMTPENCINSIDATGEGQMAMMPSAIGDISQDRAGIFVPDILEQPAYNVQKVLGGMIQFQDEMTTRKQLSMHRANAAFDDEYLGQSFMRHKLGTYMGIPQTRKMTVFDLDVDSRISLQTLDDMVGGDLDVQDFSIQRPMYYETADQMETSMTNQYSFMIASILPPLLSAAGLNRLAFDFEIAQRYGQVQKNFIVRDAGATYEITPDEMRMKAKAVEIELVNGIFAMLFETLGDFLVIVEANCTGITRVRLSLVGQGQRALADFEVPSCMGGMISPLIGDLNVSMNNSHALGELYGRVTGVTPTTAGFNEDDNEFMNYALQYQGEQTSNYDFTGDLTFNGGNG